MANLIKVRVSEELRSFLLENNKEELSKEVAVDLDIIVDLVTTHNKNLEPNTKCVALDVLLKDCDILHKADSHTKTPTTGRESELDLIKKRSEQRKYQNLVSSVRHIRMLHMQKEYRKQPDVFANFKTAIWMGINSLIGIFLTFLAGYWGAWMLNYHNEQTKLLSGMFCSLTAMVIEAILLILYDYKINKVNTHRVRESSFPTKSGETLTREQQISKIVASRETARREIAKLKEQSTSGSLRAEKRDESRERGANTKDEKGDDVASREQSDRENKAAEEAAQEGADEAAEEAAEEVKEEVLTTEAKEKIVFDCSDDTNNICNDGRVTISKKGLRKRRGNKG